MFHSKVRCSIYILLHTHTAGQIVLDCVLDHIAATPHSLNDASGRHGNADLV